MQTIWANQRKGLRYKLGGQGVRADDIRHATRFKPIRVSARKIGITTERPGHVVFHACFSEYAVQGYSQRRMGPEDAIMDINFGFEFAELPEPTKPGWYNVVQHIFWDRERNIAIVQTISVERDCDYEGTFARDPEEQLRSNVFRVTAQKIQDDIEMVRSEAGEEDFTEEDPTDFGAGLGLGLSPAGERRELVHA